MQKTGLNLPTGAGFSFQGPRDMEVGLRNGLSIPFQPGEDVQHLTIKFERTRYSLTTTTLIKVVSKAPAIVILGLSKYNNRWRTKQ